MKRTGFLITLAVLALQSPLAHAFPEMVRHGYVNCISCHVSPTGGGVITEYGRELSKEIMSTWSADGEQGVAYGLVKPPEWLNLGGDYRSIYVYRNTPTFEDGRSIFMQGDLEASATFKKFTAVVALGYQNPASAVTFGDHVITREHYLMYGVTDEISVRAGKFLPAFGIRDPNHVAITKRTLQINDVGSESYNLEGAFQNENYSAFVTVITGRPDDLSQKREHGFSLVASRALAERFKVGGSYYTGSFDDVRRHLVGPWAILGITPHLYVLTETDFLFTDPANGYATYNRLGYEVVQGVHPYFSQEYGRLDFSSPTSISQAYGLGLQWLPRPHLELNLIWQKRKIEQAYPDYTDYAYMMFHYYL